MMKKRIFLLLLIFCLGLGGCGKKEEQTKKKTTATEEMGVASKEAMLTLSMRIPETLNPLLNREETVDRILKLLFLPLLDFDESGKACPAVAQDWEFSADGRSLSMNLNSNIRWQDGTALTADDVVYSVNTLRNAPEDAVYKQVMNYVSGCSKAGTNSVVITFRDSFSSNIDALRFPVIPAGYYSGQSDTNTKPVGDGPYEMESYQQASEMKLKASASYYGSTPQISEIRVKMTAGEETDINAFEQGMTDVLVTNAMDAGKYADESVSGMHQFTSNQYDFIGFNFRKELWKDKSVRQAVAYAVPRDNLKESVYLNYAAMTNTPINPKSWLYEENVATYEYNPTMATTFLKNSGWTDADKDGKLEKEISGIRQSLRATILVNQENTGRVQIASKLKEELTAIGFEVTLDKVDFETYQQSLESGQFDLVVGGWKCSEVTDLTPFFGTGGSLNYIGYSDADMDTLLTAARTAVGEGQTLLAYSSLQKKLAEELPYISIAYRNQAVFASKNIGGEVHPVESNVFRGIEAWTYQKGE